MLNRRQWILDDILDITIDVNLLQRYTHRARLGVREHNELGIGRGLVVMEFVLRSAIREEAGNQSAAP